MDFYSNVEVILMAISCDSGNLICDAGNVIAYRYVCELNIALHLHFLFSKQRRLGPLTYIKLGPPSYMIIGKTCSLPTNQRERIGYGLTRFHHFTHSIYSYCVVNCLSV